MTLGDTPRGLAPVARRAEALSRRRHVRQRTVDRAPRRPAHARARARPSAVQDDLRERTRLRDAGSRPRAHARLSRSRRGRRAARRAGGAPRRLRAAASVSGSSLGSRALRPISPATDAPTSLRGSSTSSSCTARSRCPASTVPTSAARVAKHRDALRTIGASQLRAGASRRSGAAPSRAGVTDPQPETCSALRRSPRHRPPAGTDRFETGVGVRRHAPARRAGSDADAPASCTPPGTLSSLEDDAASPEGDPGRAADRLETAAAVTRVRCDDAPRRRSRIAPGRSTRTCAPGRPDARVARDAAAGGEAAARYRDARPRCARRQRAARLPSRATAGARTHTRACRGA